MIHNQHNQGLGGGGAAGRGVGALHLQAHAAALLHAGSKGRGEGVDRRQAAKGPGGVGQRAVAAGALVSGVRLQVG